MCFTFAYIFNKTTLSDCVFFIFADFEEEIWDRKKTCSFSSPVILEYHFYTRLCNDVPLTYLVIFLPLVSRETCGLPEVSRETCGLPEVSRETCGLPGFSRNLWSA